MWHLLLKKTESSVNIKDFELFHTINSFQFEPPCAIWTIWIVRTVELWICTKSDNLYFTFYLTLSLFNLLQSQELDFRLMIVVIWKNSNLMTRVNTKILILKKPTYFLPGSSVWQEITGRVSGHQRRRKWSGLQTTRHTQHFTWCDIVVIRRHANTTVVKIS